MITKQTVTRAHFKFITSYGEFYFQQQFSYRGHQRFFSRVRRDAPVSAADRSSGDRGHDQNRKPHIKNLTSRVQFS